MYIVHFKSIYCQVSHVRASMEYRLFIGGTWLKSVAYTLPVVPKCMESHQHSSKAIKLTTLKGVRSSEDGPLRLNKCRSKRAWHEYWLPGIHVIRLRPTATETKTHPTSSVYRPNVSYLSGGHESTIHNYPFGQLFLKLYNIKYSSLL